MPDGNPTVSFILADGTRRTAPVIDHNGTLARVSSPSILVGHSYGGAVITAARIDDRVVGLVYIAAVAPDEDETAATSYWTRFATS